MTITVLLENEKRKNKTLSKQVEPWALLLSIFPFFIFLNLMYYFCVPLYFSFLIFLVVSLIFNG